MSEKAYIHTHTHTQNEAIFKNYEWELNILCKWKDGESNKSY